MRFVAILILSTLAVSTWAAPMDHLIVISVDGLGGDLLNDLLVNDLSGDYENFQRLVDEGVSTFNARTDYFLTNTLPNHTTMITGRPVLQPSGQANTVHHGYISNSTPGPEDTLHNQGNPDVDYIASVFDVVHDHGLTTSLYTSKDKFIIYHQSYDDLNGAPDVTGVDDGRDKIDTYRYVSSGSPWNAAVLHALFMADLADGPPDFSFVHYRDLDTAGHTYGWGSTGWNDAARAVDGYLGEIMDFIDTNGELMGKTVVIVSADHGGTGTSHSLETDWRNYTIPFFVWGKYVPAGVDLYAFNPVSRLNPGEERPDYDAPVAPVRNGDFANLALSLLELPPVAGSTIKAGQDLVVTTPPTAVPFGTDEVLPSRTQLVGSFPNPFNPNTIFHFDVGHPQSLTVMVFDVAGRQVRTLAEGYYPAGRHEATWNGCDDEGNQVGTGTYLVLLKSDEGEERAKIMVLK